jgi:uncharacterized phage protein gp47/JayE
MAFQIKDTLSVVASMVNFMRATQTQITDFNVGGVARTMVEAPAIEIDELYQMMFRGLKEAIPVSVYNSFDFALLPAVGASGTVRFTLSPVSASDTPIPAGTVVTEPGGRYQYLTGVDAVIAASASYVDITCYCSDVGVDTNVSALALTTLQSAIAGVTVSNPNAFVNGADLEDDAGRKSRFRDYISNIARGTVAAIKYGASTATLKNADGLVTERVASVSVVEPYLVDPLTYPTALVWLYIHNGSGGTSVDLVADAQAIIDGYEATDGTLVPGYKAAGVIVEVSAAVEVEVDVTATVVIADNYDSAVAIAAAEVAVAEYLGGLGIGQSALVAEIIALIMGIDGIHNCAVTAPAADVAVDADEKIMAGTMAIT